VASVFFYISGHGFGHASREIEVINSLSRRILGEGGRSRESAAGICIRTSAARWLFDRTVRAPFTWLEGPTDTGVVQIDSLRLDEAETIRRAAGFYRDLPQKIAREVALLREHEARLVVCDAPPLACAAAAEAGIPCIVLANFTWDWIYEGYSHHLAAAPDLVPAIQDAYRRATAAWRLPMHGGFETFPDVVDLPWVARHATHDRTHVLRALGIPGDRPVALSSFGAYGVRDFDLETLDCLGTHTIVITGQAPRDGLPHGVAYVDETRIYDCGLRYEDLVAAVDVVVTKPGYGIVSECLANDTAMVYTSRGRFVEYDVMVAEMPRVLRCEFLDQESFLAGRWRAALHRALALPRPPERPRTDGAELAAQMLAEQLD
jgi:L-arabinokinase